MTENQVRIVMPATEIEMLHDFLQNAADMLSEVEDLVLLVEEDGEAAKDATQKIFRIVHTIKGTSGFVGLVTVERLGHRLETLMDKLRQGKRKIDPDMTDCLLAGVDYLGKLIEAARAASRNPESSDGEIRISYTEPDVQQTLDWLESEIAKEGTPALPATATPPVAAAPVLPPGYTYSFPEQLKHDFLEETSGHLGAIERILAQGKAQTRLSPEDVDGLLRAFHTIKGNAGVLVSHIEPESARKPHLVTMMSVLAHAIENLMQKRRNENRALTGDEIELLFEVHDHLHRSCAGFAAGQDFGPDISALLWKCQIFENGGGAGPTAAIDRLAPIVRALTQFETGLAGLATEPERGGALEGLQRSLEELAHLGGAAGLGEMTHLAGEAGNVVAFLLMDWPADNADLFVHELRGFVSSCRAVLAARPALAPEKKAPGGKEAEAPAPVKPGTPPPATIKVPQERLDHLMNLIGELLVSKNALDYLTRVIAIEDGRPDIAARVKEMSNAVGRIGDDLQASIMAVRMTPVSYVFGKFPRLIRDLSRKLGKEINFETVGGETELDKTVLETISDPLLHLIRNSADHGLEANETRKKLGKPAAGFIRLRASNEGQSVRIEIEDDGQGINTAKVKAKALNSGFMDAEALERLSAQEINNLIFAPGLSTAENLSEVSGRGVGMDVVLKGISAAGGRVELFSQENQGTTVVLHLPLTLAVSRGLEVEVGGEHYYLPLEYVQETVKVAPAALHYHRDDCLVVMRGEIMPVYKLGRLLGHAAAEEAAAPAHYSLVVLCLQGRRQAYMVDCFLREGEYVLKPLPGAVGEMPWVRGSMITPTGKVILVLDPLQL